LARADENQRVLRPKRNTLDDFKAPGWSGGARQTENSGAASLEEHQDGGEQRHHEEDGRYGLKNIHD
jgi:hypothetical protein